jgi:hypothetical protein
MIRRSPRTRSATSSARATVAVAAIHPPATKGRCAAVALADGIIAKQIVELAKTGERNPDLLCEAALKKLHQHLYSD